MSEVGIPVTFYVPSSAREPIDIEVPDFALRMALVNRGSIRLLDEPTQDFILSGIDRAPIGLARAAEGLAMYSTPD